MPWEVKSASLEKCVPSWTVWRQVWSDSLKACHSGVSTDVLLFSEINGSLIYHYHVHKRGLPHLAFPEGLPVLCTCICITGGGPVSGGYGVPSLLRTGIGGTTEDHTHPSPDLYHASA